MVGFIYRPYSRYTPLAGWFPLSSEYWHVESFILSKTQVHDSWWQIRTIAGLITTMHRAYACIHIINSLLACKITPRKTESHWEDRVPKNGFPVQNDKVSHIKQSSWPGGNQLCSVCCLSLVFGNITIGSSTLLGILLPLMYQPHHRNHLKLTFTSLNYGFVHNGYPLTIQSRGYLGRETMNFQVPRTILVWHFLSKSSRGMFRVDLAESAFFKLLYLYGRLRTNNAIHRLQKHLELSVNGCFSK